MPFTTLTSAIAASLLLGTAKALPMLYAQRHDGCEIPDQAYGGHMAPEEDPDVTLALMDESGSPVMAWMPGGTYMVEIQAYGTAPVNAWLHSTDGEFAAGEGGISNGCTPTQGVAWWSRAPAASHMVEWTAPMGSDCVTVSTAQAAGPSDSYHTATAELCPMGSAPAPAPEEEEEGGEGSDSAATGAMPPSSSTPPEAGNAVGLAAAAGAVCAAAAALLV